jgi:hypothetical protein
MLKKFVNFLDFCTTKYILILINIRLKWPELKILNWNYEKIFKLIKKS